MLRSVRPRRVTVCCCCCGRTPTAGARGRRAYALPPPPTTAPPSSVSTSSESPSTLLPPPASLPGSSRQPRKTPDAAPDFGSRPSPFLAKDAVRPAIGVSPTIAPSAARLPWSKRQSDASPSVASALPHSSFDKLFSRTLEYLDNPDLAQPDPHAAHSEVGRAFVGELRDIDGNVVEGRQLANLALRLGVIGVIKREMGAIEKISFLPDPDTPEGILQSQDRFGLTLASVPAIAPPTQLKSHPLTRQLLYLPVQPGYAFAFQLPRWSHQPDRGVGGPSLEEVILLATGHDGDENGGVRVTGRKLTLGELVEKERSKGDALVPTTGDQQVVTDGTEASRADVGALANEVAATTTLTEKASLATASDDGAVERDLSQEAQSAQRETAIRRSLIYTVVLTPLSKNAVRTAEETYPPSLTFAHPYPPITNATHFRYFETRLWPALQTFSGFGGGLDRARSAMARRLGLENITGSIEDERRKLRKLQATSGQNPASKPNRALAPHLKTPKTPRASVLAPRTPPPPGSSAPSPSLLSEKLARKLAAGASSPSKASDERAKAPDAPKVPTTDAAASQRNTNESTFDLPPTAASPEASAPAQTEDVATNALDHLYEERPPVRPYLSVPSLAAVDEAAETAAAEARAVDADVVRQPRSGDSQSSTDEQNAEQTASQWRSTSWLSKLFGGGRGSS